MKKNLFWSLLAATAMLTACGDDAIVDQPIVATGPETPVSFKINMGNAIQTYATDVTKGGWSNYKASELNGFYARATVQVFAEGATNTAPLAEARTVLQDVPTPGASEDVINVPNLRLPAGATYTAVVWVDFIKNTTSKVDARNDYYWDTENLSAVKDIKMVQNLALIDGTDSPESRDAYTSTLKFTVNADGTYQNGDQFATGGTANTTALEITAKRTLAKVSLVLTDYDTKEAWAAAFNNVDANRQLDYLAVGVNNLSTEYNALTQKPVTSVAGADSYFHRGFSIPADKDATDVNGVNWISESGKFYPVMDFNYVIPAVAEKDASKAIYSLKFKGYNHGVAADFSATEAAFDEISTSTTANEWKLVALRNASSVPVRTNAHTIIKLNLYKEYSCKVTIVDLFDGGKEDVTVNDDATKGSKDDHYINENGPINNGNITGAAHVVVIRDNGGYATSITITGVTAANFDKVMEDIDAMVKLSDTDIDMTAISIPLVADFSKVPADNAINLEVTTTIAASTELNGLAADLNLTASTEAAATLTVKSDADVKFVAGTYAGVVEVMNNTTGSDVANAIIAGGTFNNNFNSYVNTTVSGGSMSQVQTAGLIYDYHLTMKGEVAHALTINKDSSAFGALNADKNISLAAIHNLYYKNETVKNLYSGMNGGDTQWAAINVTP